MKYRIDLIWQSQSGTTKTIDKTQLDDIKSISCYIATLGITQKKVILFEISDKLKIPILDSKKFRGVEIQLIDGGLNKYLSVILLEPSLYQIFLLFSDDLLSNVGKAIGQKDAVKNILETINVWRKLFERSKIDGLSFEQQKGLYGELLMIRFLLKNGINAEVILNAWSGPDAKNNDFQFAPLSIEVKTTSANQPALSITNEHQLAYSSRLFLVLFVLADRNGVSNTLPQLIDEIRSALVTYEPGLEELFEEKLESVGYFGVNRENYAGTEYLTRQIMCYAVDNNFPRIVPDNVMDGIFSIAYKIELSACAPHLTDFPDSIIQLLTDESSD